MHTLPIVTGAALALLAMSATASAADAAAGRNAFLQQCALCHRAGPANEGGAQGPDLAGIRGRKAGSVPGFPYTDALKHSGLRWNAQSLDRFLASPQKLVPGTAMVIEVADATQRADLVAFLRSVQGKPVSGAAAAAGAAAASASTGDWRNDRPGRVHRIDAGALPAPFATASVRNTPRVVPEPAGATLAAPPGFAVSVFSEDVQRPRFLRTAPNGDIFVAESSQGRVRVLRPAASGATAERSAVFAQGLTGVYGIAFYPAGPDPEWVYVAETQRVLRFPYRSGDLEARAPGEVVIARLSDSDGGHSTRTLEFAPDGKRLFVSVGSRSNVAETQTVKSAEQIREWEANEAQGAAWDDERHRADVLAFDMDAQGGPREPARVFATGLRNCVGLALQPATGSLWCSGNERDGLGNELVPDYATRVREGGYYGWPWYYLGDHEEPRLAGRRPDLRGKAIVPDVLFTAHSAATGLVFYDARAGAAAFPSEYVGEAFAVFHGSWNRSERTGHKVVRLRMQDGKPTGEYEDFLTGFIVADDAVWGRPVAATVAADGALLVSDDGGNRIYRVAWAGAK
jgi:glucose/arabinose dehydrogenase